MAEGRGSATLYRIDFMRNLNLVVKIVGEGNSEVVDDYSIICMHGGGNAQFKQKQRKVNMIGMNCKWLRMSNIS